jgi:hypothetical protein
MKIKVVKGSVKIVVERGGVHNLKNMYYGGDEDDDEFIAEDGGFDTRSNEDCFLVLSLKDGTIVAIDDEEIVCKNGQLHIPAKTFKAGNMTLNNPPMELKTYSVSDNVEMNQIDGKQTVLPIDNGKASIYIKLIVD